MILDTTHDLATADAAPLIIGTDAKGEPVYKVDPDTGDVIQYPTPAKQAEIDAAAEVVQAAALAQDALVAAKHLLDSDATLKAHTSLVTALDEAATILTGFFGEVPIDAVAVLGCAIARNTGDPDQWVADARTILKVRGEITPFALAVLAAAIGDGA